METVDLTFEEFGTCATPPLIILHGFFASSRNWRKSPKNWQFFPCVFAKLEKPWFVAASSSNELPCYVGRFAPFMDEKIKTASLLGHSMGGKVAMWFALNNADRVDRLIVVDIAPISYTHCFNDLIRALKSLPLSEISNRKQAESWLAPYISELSYRQFLLQNLVLMDEKYCWRINLDIFIIQRLI